MQRASWRKKLMQLPTSLLARRSFLSRWTHTRQQSREMPIEMYDFCTTPALFYLWHDSERGGGWVGGGGAERCFKVVA